MPTNFIESGVLSVLQLISIVHASQRHQLVGQQVLSKLFKSTLFNSKQLTLSFYPPLAVHIEVCILDMVIHLVFSLQSHLEKKLLLIKKLYGKVTTKRDVLVSIKTLNSLVKCSAT